MIDQIQRACSQLFNNALGHLRTLPAVHGILIDLMVLFSFDIGLRESREAVGESGIEMVDLESIERAKAMKRRLEEDPYSESL